MARDGGKKQLKTEANKEIESVSKGIQTQPAHTPKKEERNL